MIIIIKDYYLFIVQASRATFQHWDLKNTTIRNKAMDAVKDAMNNITFQDEDSDFLHPIPYTMMYVQWEANIVSVTLEKVPC